MTRGRGFHQFEGGAGNVLPGLAEANAIAVASVGMKVALVPAGLGTKNDAGGPVVAGGEVDARRVIARPLRIHVDNAERQVPGAGHDRAGCKRRRGIVFRNRERQAAGAAVHDRVEDSKVELRALVAAGESQLHVDAPRAGGHFERQHTELAGVPAGYAAL